MSKPDCFLHNSTQPHLSLIKPFEWNGQFIKESIRNVSNKSSCRHTFYDSSHAPQVRQGAGTSGRWQTIIYLTTLRYLSHNCLIFLWFTSGYRYLALIVVVFTDSSSQIHLLYLLFLSEVVFFNILLYFVYWVALLDSLLIYCLEFILDWLHLYQYCAPCDLFDQAIRMILDTHVTELLTVS